MKFEEFRERRLKELAENIEFYQEVLDRFYAEQRHLEQLR